MISSSAITTIFRWSRFFFSLLLLRWMSSPHHHHCNNCIGVAALSPPHPSSGRRAFLKQSTFLFLAVPSCIVVSPRQAVAESTNKEFYLTRLLEARQQLDAVPKLIEKEKWDTVRSVLITPPLSDLWSKSGLFLQNYAETVKDELAVLEARDELSSHLRFLDMAVYNNVFNPITVQGKSGATKELIASYYEDPVNEFKASASALEELIQLGKE